MNSLHYVHQDRFFSRQITAATLAVGLAALFLPGSVRAQSDVAVLHAFLGTQGDGQNAYPGILESSDGALYGATTFGGVNNVGTVYKVNLDGSGYARLYSFGTITSDARHPFGSLVEGDDGALYGTSYDGGTGNNGAVFRLSKDGTGAAVIKSFGRSDGRISYSPLVKGSDGLFYGVTYFGGSSDRGVLFKLGADGSAYQVLHHFTGSGGDGSNPFGGLMEGSDGLLYGSTQIGGTTDMGTLFRIGKDGSAYQVLVRFAGGASDGRGPRSALLEAGDGALYGFTCLGGAADAGTAFKLNKDGTGYALLRSFISKVTDGQCPHGGPVEHSDGGLYGLTVVGGDHDRGAVFRMNKDGTGLTVVASFAGTDGQYPAGPPIITTDGQLWGTTSGALSYGTSGGTSTVFRVTTQWPAPVLTDAKILPDGAFQFQFTYRPGASFEALATPDVAQLLSLWTVLGSIPETSPGRFQFTDPQALNSPHRFYQVRTVSRE